MGDGDTSGNAAVDSVGEGVGETKSVNFGVGLGDASLIVVPEGANHAEGNLFLAEKTVPVKSELAPELEIPITEETIPLAKVALTTTEATSGKPNAVARAACEIFLSQV